MQVAGNLCEECGEKLFIEAEGLMCSYCDLAFCHDCLNGSSNCTKCGVDMLALRVAREAEKIEGDKIAERRKSLNLPWYPWFLGIVIVYNVFNGAQKAASGNQIEGIFAAIVFLFFLWLLVDYFRRGVPIGVSRKPPRKRGK